MGNSPPLENLYYSREHAWLQIETDKTVKIGITRYAVDLLKDIVQIQIKAVGTKVDKMTPIGIVESVKAISEIIAPITGIITAVNSGVISQPWLINYDPYGDGWIALLEPSNLKEEIKTLITAREYERLIENRDKG